MALDDVPGSGHRRGARRRDETGAVAAAAMTRTEAIMRAVCQELEAQRTKIDRADDVDMLVIKLPFRRGHLVPRAVRISTETETVLGKVR